MEESNKKPERTPPFRKKKSYPGKKAHGKGYKGPKRRTQGRPKVPREVLEKAKEIASRTGVSMRDAIRVASGKITVQQVLKEMMFEEKVNGLMRKHGLERAMAINIARGMVDLETALLLKEMKRCSDWVPERSVLLQLNETGEPGFFYLFGQEPFSARVTKVEKYDVWFQRTDEEPEKVEKHCVLMACRPQEQEELQKLMAKEENVSSLGLGPSTSYKDRYRSRKRILYRHHRDRIPTRVVLRDGTLIDGRLGWFGKWEFQFHMTETCSPVVFRHAMYSFDPMGGMPEEKEKAETDAAKDADSKESDSNMRRSKKR